MRKYLLNYCILIFMLACTPLSYAKTNLHHRHYVARGYASWYGKRFHHRRTYSGERFNMYAMTAAHRTLPIHTRIEVTNLRNGRKVFVRINDRGPFKSRRIIDLSYGAAKRLGMTGRGIAPVRIRTI